MSVCSRVVTPANASSLPTHLPLIVLAKISLVFLGHDYLTRLDGLVNALKEVARKVFLVVEPSLKQNDASVNNRLYSCKVP